RDRDPDRTFQYCADYPPSATVRGLVWSSLCLPSERGHDCSTIGKRKQRKDNRVSGTRPQMARTAYSLRCGDSVGFRRDFCPAEEAAGRRNIDPYLPSAPCLYCVTAYPHWPLACAGLLVA